MQQPPGLHVFVEVVLVDVRHKFRYTSVHQCFEDGFLALRNFVETHKHHLLPLQLVGVLVDVLRHLAVDHRAVGLVLPFQHLLQTAVVVV